MRVFLVDGQDNKIKQVANVVRYYSEKKRNTIKYDKGDDTSLAKRNFNRSLVLVGA